jgi:TRAP-type C4-dicarboxylate transport system permease small subunit
MPLSIDSRRNYMPSRGTVTRFISGYFKVIKTLCIMFLIMEVAVISYVVFGRYVLSRSPGWGEEMALFCMIWFALLSASFPVRDGSHIRLSLFVDALPRKIQIPFHFLSTMLVYCFAAFLVIEGFRLTSFSRRAIMPGMEISTAWLYLALPVSGISIFIAALEGPLKRVLCSRNK